MHSKVPLNLRSTVTMFHCVFGSDHSFSDREIAVLIDIMGDQGMSDRNVATVVALLRGRSADDYADCLQFVSWAYQAKRADPVMKRNITERLQKCGFAEWQQED